MAFSKAKILRFNDITTCAPPPGSYNPKFDDHISGAVVYTKDNKPLQAESPATSVSDTKSVHSCAGGRTFRTPTLPRRKRTSLPSKQKEANLITKLFSPVKSEALREKIVECANKDETIKDLETQIEELKFTISALKVDKSELAKDVAQNSDRIKEIQDHVEKKLKINFEEAENMLKETEYKLAEKENKLAEKDEKLIEKEDELAEKEDKCCNLITELSQLRKEYDELKIKYEESLCTCADLRTSLESEMNSLKSFHNSEINSLKENTTDIIEKWKETVKQTEEDHLNKINLIKEKQSSDLNGLKESFASEKQELEKKTEEYKTEISKLLIELEDARKQINVEIELRELNMKKSSEEQHRLEITFNKTYETVDALKNRLLNSDRDVEQLNKEIEQLKWSMLEMESKHSEANEKLTQVLEERDLLIAENASLIQVHEMVATLKKNFAAKIDSLKSIGDLEIKKLNEELCDAKTELHSYLQEKQQINADVDNVITNIRTEYERMEIKMKHEKNSLKESFKIQHDTIKSQEEIISEQNTQIQQLKDRLKEREQEMNEIASVYKKFIDRSKEYDALQQKYEELLLNCSALEKTVENQNFLIGPFREQLENYERECQSLIAYKCEAEKEAKEIGLKYAQILGHQNNKQKIKHIVDLKKKNFELMEHKNDCEIKLNQQKRTIEKLKQKISLLTKSSKSLQCQELDKENIQSPGQVQNSPLRERKDIRL